MNPAGLIAAALALILVAENVPTSPSLSRTQIDAMAPEAVAHLLFGERSNLLPLWQTPGNSRRIDAPLELLMFRSPGRSSGTAGLCVSDQIQMGFEPAGPIQGAATPVRPTRTWSSPIFYLANDRVALSAAPVGENARPAADAECRSIDPRHVHVFLARDPERLARTLAIVEQAIAAAQRGVTPVPIDCSATGGQGHVQLGTRECMALVARIEMDRADQVRPCPEEAWNCTRIEISLDPPAGSIDLIELRILDGEPGAPPSRLIVTPIAPPSLDTAG
jgi:hypothetical protein